MNKKILTYIGVVLIFGIALIVGIMKGYHEEESTEKISSIPDQEAIQEQIKQSIANYKGQCPCPYSIAKNGTKCGDRSAWSQHNGESPLCYESDLTPKFEWSLEQKKEKAESSN